jgi:hypothetical protein
VTERVSRFRVGEAVVRARPPASAERDVARELFREHLDLAAIRRALGQPRPSQLHAQREGGADDVVVALPAEPAGLPAEPAVVVPVAGDDHLEPVARAQRSWSRRAFALAAGVLALVVAVPGSVGVPDWPAIDPVPPSITAEPPGALFRDRPATAPSAPSIAITDPGHLAAPPLRSPGADMLPTGWGEPSRVVAQTIAPRPAVAAPSFAPEVPSRAAAASVLAVVPGAPVASSPDLLPSREAEPMLAAAAASRPGPVSPRPRPMAGVEGSIAVFARAVVHYQGADRVVATGGVPGRGVARGSAGRDPEPDPLFPRR